ncbi:MAG: hypothetical protein IKZ28_02120, partial [Clostridia bacterium]|nr:hypothetical protein [Clostridia bacterium]
CAHCKGNGHVPEDIFVITRIRTALIEHFANGNNTAVVDLNANIMRKIFQEELFAIEAKNRWKDKKIYFVPHKTFKEDYFTIKGEEGLPVDSDNQANLLK